MPGRKSFSRRSGRIFGEGGVEKIVERVATMEQALGIDDLAQFAPT
jgi:hypothetical protein